VHLAQAEPVEIFTVAQRGSGRGFFVYWLAPAALVAVLGLFLFFDGIGVANLFPRIFALAIGSRLIKRGQRPAHLRLRHSNPGAPAARHGRRRRRVRLAYGVVPIFLLGELLASRLGSCLSQEPAADLVSQ
jgi:hypothetical protein